jgi:hypothetical protein
MSEFTSIAAMFISDLIGTTTIFGNGLLRSRVWIKVCHTKSNVLWEINTYNASTTVLLRRVETALA